MLRTELQLKLDDSVFWTDSPSVLEYIPNENTRFQTFVANRISVIRENTSVSQWSYVDTRQHPADDGSRGLSGNKFLECKRWIHGPMFLWKPEVQWPLEHMNSVSLTFDDPEIKNTVVVCSATVIQTENPTNKLLSYFSTWMKLKTAVAWFLKVKKVLQSLVQERK